MLEMKKKSVHNTHLSLNNTIRSLSFVRKKYVYWVENIFKQKIDLILWINENKRHLYGYIYDHSWVSVKSSTKLGLQLNIFNFFFSSKRKKKIQLPSFVLKKMKHQQPKYQCLNVISHIVLASLLICRDLWQEDQFCL